MPDLDQIKQGEQERGTARGGYRRADRARPRGRRSHANRAGDEGGSGMRFAADPLQVQQTVIAGAIETGDSPERPLDARVTAATEFRRRTEGRRARWRIYA
jgi:hypothetical protein